MSTPSASDWLGEEEAPNHELSQIAFTENQRVEDLAVSKETYGERRTLRSDELRLADAAVDLGDLIEGGHRFSWLRHELSLPGAGAPRSRGAGAPPTFEVLHALGIPVTEWFSIVLHDPSPSGPTVQSALPKRNHNDRRTV